MATLKEDDSSWRAGGIKVRDARHTHDGPEVPRYRKAHRRKTCKGGKPHDFSKRSEKWLKYNILVIECRVCGKQSWRHRG